MNPPGPRLRFLLSRSWLPPQLLLALGMALIVAPATIHNLPGDLTDSRLNSYFLEHVLQRLTGKVSSFWNAPFFYPYEMTIAFSDNHLGDSPPYVLARLAGLDRENAFALWYATGFLLNFIAAAVALSRLGFSPVASGLGAFLFTFALPMTAQEGHAQLVYRFGVPLAALALVEAHRRGSLRQVVLMAFWTVWQFYCSIYIGYFLVLLLGALAVSLVLCAEAGPLAGVMSWPRATWRAWTARTRLRRVGFIAVMAVLVLALVILFRPYLLASRVYGMGRLWWEVAQMVPRPSSYLYSLNSLVWPVPGPDYQSLPLFWEHAMFFGIAPFLALAMAAGLILAGRAQWNRIATPFVIAWLLLVVITLYIDGYSLYRALVALPGVGAIRGVTRIILVMLFPASVLLAACVDAIAGARPRGLLRLGALAALTGLVIFEASFIRHTTEQKVVWRQRMASVASALPATLPAAPILLLGPPEGQAKGSVPFDPGALWQRQLDAMLFAQDRGWATINGYSGNDPRDYRAPDECATGIHNLARGLAFKGRSAERQAMARRIVMVGFVGCASPVDLMSFYERAQSIDFTLTDNLGEDRCGVWSEVRRERVRGWAWGYEQWLLGSISTTTPVVPDRPKAWAFFDAWCEAHPLATVADAGRAYRESPPRLEGIRP